MSRIYRYNTLDGLADTQFAGVPVAVFAAAEGLDPRAMQKIASSLHLPETVFVFRGSEKGIHARVRAFSHRGEKALAGASMVAVAWVLGGHLVIPRLRLETSAGLLEIEMERSGDLLHRALWSMPIPRLGTGPEPSALRSALGLREESSESAVSYQGESAQCLIQTSRDQLSAISLHPQELASTWSGGIFAYAEEDGVRARYFSANPGADESALELSAVGVLGYHLLMKRASEESAEIGIEIQAEQGRPSTAYVSLGQDSGVPAVRVGGAAVVTGRGEFALRGESSP